MSRDDVLLMALNGGDPIEEYYRRAIGAVELELRQMKRDQLLATDEAELLEHLRDTQWALEVIEQDPDRPVTSSPEHTRKRTLEIPLVPREPNARSLALRGSAWPAPLIPPPPYKFRKADHVLLVTVDPNQRAVDTALEHARKCIEYINAEIPKWTISFNNKVTELIQSRKAQVQREAKQDDELDAHMNSLGIVLKRKTDAVEPVNVTVRRSVQMLRSLPSIKSTIGETFLNPKALAEILRLTDLMGKNFELAPVTYNKLEEEDLRNIIVATLNAVLEGEIATAETFSRLGHSDIKLNIPAGDIFIAECKIWRGQREYHKSIDQLFRYLTHRHSVGVLITFVREEGIRMMTARAQKATTSHPSYRAGTLDVKSYVYHISVHKHPTDPEGDVTIHHLFFHLYEGVPDGPLTKVQQDAKEG